MRNMITFMGVLVAMAVCGAVLAPAPVMAEQLEVLGTAEFVPGINHETFNLRPGAKQISVSVLNGSKKEKKWVRSARIAVNSNELFSPDVFNKKEQVTSVTKSWLVDDPNMTEVEVTGRIGARKGAKLIVTVTAHYDDPPDPVVIIMYFLDCDQDGVGGFTSMPGDIMSPPPPVGSCMWVPIGGDMDDNP